MLRLRFNTISKRLFFLVSLLLSCIVIIILLSILFLKQSNETHKIAHAIDNQRILVVRLVKSDLDFFRFETVNEKYYLGEESLLLRDRTIIAFDLELHSLQMKSWMIRNGFDAKHRFNEFDSLLRAYNETFERLVQITRYRGFKDFGLEGEMRTHAHTLETSARTIPIETLLMLRRHEKDFFLRKEPKYISLFNSLCSKIEKENAVDSVENFHVKNYQRLFNQLASLDTQIGITPTDGLLGLLNRQTLAMSSCLEELADLSIQFTHVLIRRSALLFISITAFVLVISLIAVYYTSSLLAKPIKKLSLIMKTYVIKEELNENNWSEKSSPIEVQLLASSFFSMTKMIRKQFQEIQETSTIMNKQNEDLKRLNHELDRFIYSSAHDLKSPLSSLSGLINLARLEIDTKDHNHYFDKMDATVQKLESFIQDITDYAKNKRQRLLVEEVDFELIINNVLGELQHLPQASFVKSFVRVSGSKAITDKTRLEIIVKNIVSNSFRYYDFKKENSFIFIEIEIDDNFIVMSFRDNGIGIAEFHLSKIFNMFYRGVDTGHGAGIGLFLVRESVRMLEGSISVESSLGHWTNIAVTLPNCLLGWSKKSVPEEVEIETEDF